MSTIKFHYAMQVCDLASREAKSRYCGDDRTLLSKKSIRSFLKSIDQLAQRSDTEHYVRLVMDRSSAELISWLDRELGRDRKPNIHIEIHNLNPGGICEGIKQCYLWLQDHGQNFVFQVQDDYLFEPSCLEEMASVFFQIHNETGSDCIVSPYNDSWLWLSPYRNRPTPRTVIVGKNRYWIQYYDMSCSFFTSHRQFSQHWDLYEMFFVLLAKLTKDDKDLENRSLNYMLTQRGVLGLVPVTSLALHVQSELERDPHIDWQARWEAVDVA